MDNTKLNIPGNFTKGNEINLYVPPAIEMINTEYLNCLLIYTDGSLTVKDKWSRAGYYIPHLNDNFYISTTSSSSLNTELFAVDAAVSFCIARTLKKYAFW